MAYNVTTFFLIALTAGSIAMLGDWIQLLMVIEGGGGPDKGLSEVSVLIVGNCQKNHRSFDSSLDIDGSSDL